MSDRTDLAPDRLLALLDRLSDLAVRTDLHHRLVDHPGCDHPGYQEWVEQVTAEFRAELTPDADEIAEGADWDSLSPSGRWRREQTLLQGREPRRRGRPPKQTIGKSQ